MKPLLQILVLNLVVACQLANADNEISIEQTGDNLLLEFEQVGDNNVINTVFSGVYLDTAISQQGKRNQVLKLSQGVSGDNNLVVVEQWNNTVTTDVNKIWIDIDGDNNGVDVGQGCKFYYASSTECSRDTHEDAGHEMEINITGDNNAIRGGQKAGTANPDHNLTIDINSNNNQVWFTQAGSGAKNLDLTQAAKPFRSKRFYVKFVSSEEMPRLKNQLSAQQAPQQNWERWSSLRFPFENSKRQKSDPRPQNRDPLRPQPLPLPQKKRSRRSEHHQTRHHEIHLIVFQREPARHIAQQNRHSRDHFIPLPQTPADHHHQYRCLSQQPNRRRIDDFHRCQRERRERREIAKAQSACRNQTAKRRNLSLQTQSENRHGNRNHRHRQHAGPRRRAFSHINPAKRRPDNCHDQANPSRPPRANRSFRSGIATRRPQIYFF